MPLPTDTRRDRLRAGHNCATGLCAPAFFSSRAFARDPAEATLRDIAREMREQARHLLRLGAHGGVAMNPRDVLASGLAWSGLVTLQLAELSIGIARLGLLVAENAIPVACERLSAVTARLRTPPFDDSSESRGATTPANRVCVRSEAPETRSVAA